MNRMRPNSPIIHAIKMTRTTEILNDRKRAAYYLALVLTVRVPLPTLYFRQWVCANHRINVLKLSSPFRQRLFHTTVTCPSLFWPTFVLMIIRRTLSTRTLRTQDSIYVRYITSWWQLFMVRYNMSFPGKKDTYHYI
jgi:hypothetical protein